MKSNYPVVTRFAPSPTGNLHIGTARTALFTYLFTKKNKGKIFLRIDDTDKDRSSIQFEDNIKDGLNWLGLQFDQTYNQSARGDIYKLYLEILLKTGQAYFSKESPKKEGERAAVIRFKNPGQRISFNDLIRGSVEFETKELGDFVIARDLNSPLYHFASVVDDYESGITHIIRGEDHLSNTPRQILIARAIGATRPIFAHLPLILAPDRSKLSKRHGALAITDYRERGYLPQAINNFLTLLGWSPQAVGINKEVFTLEELIEYFDLNKVQKGAAAFNQAKLDWLNREHLKRLTDNELLSIMEIHLPAKIKNRPLYSKKRLNNIKPILLERITTLADIKTLAEAGELDYFFDLPVIDRSMLKNTKYLPALVGLLEKIPEANFTPAEIKKAIWNFATEKGRGEVLWPFRVALTGRERSPDPFAIAAVIGKKETLARVKSASL